MNTAPSIIHFPPKGGRKRQDQMEFQRVGFAADAIAKFVQERTDVNVSCVCIKLLHVRSHVYAYADSRAAPS